MIQIEEENARLKCRIDEQDELIEALYVKQGDSKALKKEIKLLKENLVNQNELMDEIQNLKASNMNTAEHKITRAREKAIDALRDIVDEIISTKQPNREIQNNQHSRVGGILIPYDGKIVPISKTNAIIIQAINSIMDYNTPKQMFVLSDIHLTLHNCVLSHNDYLQPVDLRRHEFLQNLINRLFNCPVKDGHRVTDANLSPFGRIPPDAVENLTIKYITKTLKIIEVFVGELLEIQKTKINLIM
jgi:hypothetical protein